MTQIKLWIMGGEHTERKTKANWEHVPVPYSDNSSVLCLQKKKKTCFEKCVFRARHLTHFSRVQKVKNDKLQVQGETDSSGHSTLPKILDLTFLNGLRLILIEMQHHDGFWKWWENLEMHLKAVFELPCLLCFMNKSRPKKLLCPSFRQNF